MNDRNFPACQDHKKLFSNIQAKNINRLEKSPLGMGAAVEKHNERSLGMDIDKCWSGQNKAYAGGPDDGRPRTPNWVVITQKTPIGSSPLFRHCLKLASSAAKAHKNVVIQGETGTGKDLFARFIHARSGSPPGRFVGVDCRIPGDESIAAVLAESGESCRGHPGLLTLVKRGTLYLDEINELSPLSQERICSLLQECGRQVKVIAASQQNLETLAKQGRFRNDLLHLLQNLRIDLPALRERPEDILELTRFFLNRLCLWQGIDAKIGTPEFNAMLLNYPWPGNVRELVNTLEQSLLTAGLAKTLFPKHLPGHIRIRVARASLLHSPIFP